MKNAIIWLVVLAVILGGFVILVERGAFQKEPAPAPEPGDYAYRCDGGVELSVTPATDGSSVRLLPGEGSAFEESVLLFKNGDEGARFEGNGIILIGAGEGIRVVAGTQTLNCQPVPDAENAPYNFGDAGEGGGEKPDLALIVTESMGGLWLDIDDAKHQRLFQADGTVIDHYEGEPDVNGTWEVYTAETAKPDVKFALQPDVAYVRITMAGSEGQATHFKLVTLTPETLELSYLDHVGTQRFNSAD
jgi:hypothetical protein